MNRSWAVALLLIAGLIASAAAQAEPAISLADDFENSALDRSLWTTHQITRARYKIDDQVAASADGQSLEITTQASDKNCFNDENPCQRNEIRVRKDRRIAFGTDAWYGFSFRVDGFVYADDSNRLVIGQWKEDSGGSPFVAQRFDDRNFRITVQDNECRAVIAEMLYGIDLSGELLFLSSHTMKCARAPKITLTPPDRAQHILPDPYKAWVHMVYRIRGGRDGDGLVEVWVDGECVVRAEGSIGNRDFAGSKQYFKFGVYRDKVAYTTRVHLDNFRRAASHLEIDPDFIPCPWWGG